VGIENIHILIEHDLKGFNTQVRELQAASRIAEHRRGEHQEFGNKRRDCPLCREGR